jgi:hypothetical protein
VERRMIRSYDRLAREHGDESSQQRRSGLRRRMTRRRKAIWRAGERTGWDRFRRRERYRSLLARSR